MTSGVVAHPLGSDLQRVAVGLPVLLGLEVRPQVLQRRHVDRREFIVAQTDPLPRPFGEKHPCPRSISIAVRQNSQIASPCKIVDFPELLPPPSSDTPGCRTNVSLRNCFNLWNATLEIISAASVREPPRTAPVSASEVPDGLASPRSAPPVHAFGQAGAERQSVASA